MRFDVSANATDETNLQIFRSFIFQGGSLEGRFPGVQNPGLEDDSPFGRLFGRGIDLPIKHGECLRWLASAINGLIKCGGRNLFH